MKVIPASYGLLGEHLAHSWSPEIHALLGADSYALIEAAFDEVDDVFTSQNWKGLNVTIPYKQKALLSANVASEAARTIGAANTLVRYGNTVFAENTDAMGFYWLLERFARFTTGLSANDFLNKKTVLVLGATGGAGRAVSYLCTKLGAHVVGMSRS
ncbi:MAG: shikimate dehydrogenase family protein, partial [Lancefieldella rimae]